MQGFCLCNLSPGCIVIRNIDMRAIAIIWTMLPLFVLAQTKTLNVNYMLRGYFYAGSSIRDTLAPGGFWESPNKPMPLNTQAPKFNGEGILLVADTTERTAFGKTYKGYKVYLANNTDTLTGFRASDSRLSIVAEAFIDKKWQPIEYLPSSWCGNSYHTVYLQPKEYWEFVAPAYSGNIKTKLRFKLIRQGQNSIYSNEIYAGINRKQLNEKEGHTPQGIMGPYND